MSEKFVAIVVAVLSISMYSSTAFASAPPVAPEPVSSVLFLAGGAVLAYRYYKGKDK